VSDVREFRVTFGEKYAREEHPHLSGAHPDGWATVWATDVAQARKIAYAHLGRFWSDVYDATEWGDWSWWTLGELITLNPEAKP
jgi:hypothetical protein